MYQKLLIASLIIGAGCMTGYAQDKKTFATPEEAAKAAAVEYQKELLDNMAWHLRNLNANNKGEHNVTITNSNDFQQFLYEKGEKLDSLFYDKKKGGKQETKKSEDRNLKKVYDKLVKNATPVDLTYDDTKSTGDVECNKEKVSVEVESKTLTTANDSKARYEVVGTWEVEIAPETDVQKVLKGTNKKGKEIYDKEKVTVGYYAKNTTPKSIVAKPTDGYLSSEIENMEKSVTDKIVKWYANLPETLDKEYANQANKGIPTYNINADDIKIKREGGRRFSVTGKNVDISVDPKPYMTEPEVYYDENPEATLTVTPSFNIAVADDFKTIESMNVKYDTDIKGPNTIKEKLEMRDKAAGTIKEFGERLSEYVSTKDKAKKEEIVGMFESKDREISVSHKSKNGREDIKPRKVGDYLNRINGTNLTFETGEMVDRELADNLNSEHPKLGVEYDSNLNSVMYKISQKFESKTYSDSTEKIVFLNYKSEDKTYYINKIEVVPGSTEIE